MIWLITKQTKVNVVMYKFKTDFIFLVFKCVLMSASYNYFRTCNFVAKQWNMGENSHGLGQLENELQIGSFYFFPFVTATVFSVFGCKRKVNHYKIAKYQ